MIPVGKLYWTARPVGTAAGQLASFLIGRLAVLRYTSSMFTLQYITSVLHLLCRSRSIFVLYTAMIDYPGIVDLVHNERKGKSFYHSRI